MDDRDPPPFGYTFSSELFGGAPTGAENGGPSLLSDVENTSLMDFFNQGPWSSELPNFATAPEARDNFANWGEFVPPPTIHDISTSIADPAQLHEFSADSTFAAPPSTNHFNITADDFQAASTLHNNAHMPQLNGRSYSFHGLPTTSVPAEEPVATGFQGIPMVPTEHGMVREQLTSLLPNHDAPGTVDADLVARFARSAAREVYENQTRELGLQRHAPLRRSYTYGTDSAFNESGFQVSSKHETDEAVTKRLMADIRHAEAVMDAASGTNGTKLKSPTGHRHHPSKIDIQSGEDGASDEETTDEDEDDDRPAKKRRKSKVSPTKNGKARKSISGAAGKNRKASVDDRVNKKKRGSTAGQKAQRENLSEEQKRSNHILSEQKRRNLIKNGFKELEELVPQIRNGGLSKSGVLVEAANFLEELIKDNKNFLEVMDGVGG